MKNIFLILILALIFYSCKPGKTATSNAPIQKPNAASLNGNWELQMLFASDNNWPKPPFINFDIATGTFTGNSSCNNLTGSFNVSGNYFAFNKNIIQTKMACTGSFENNFSAALLKITSYSYNKDELELRQGEIVLMKFRRSK